jgi:hypothetical protein
MIRCVAGKKAAPKTLKIELVPETSFRSAKSKERKKVEICDENLSCLNSAKLIQTFKTF